MCASSQPTHPNTRPLTPPAAVHPNTARRSVFPNCTAKAKSERQLYVGQQLLEARELGGMVVRRPMDRVSGLKTQSAPSPQPSHKSARTHAVKHALMPS